MTIQLSPDLLQGPIPGMSLTKEPGAYPWERPTQLTTVDEAVDFYAERLLNEKTEDSFLKAIDNGVSIEKLAEMLTVSATMNGVHNLDVSFLINPYVREVMKLIAEGAGQDYVDSYSELDSKKKVPYRLIKEMVQETLDEEGELIENQEPVAKGLMARPTIGEAVEETEPTKEDITLPEEEV